MKKKKVILRVYIVLWLCLIWGHSLQPANISEHESGFFLRFFATYLPFITNNDLGMFIVRKAAHFTEYLVLGIMLCLEFRTYLHGFIKRFSVPSMVGLFIAFIDETIQLFVVGR